MAALVPRSPASGGSTFAHAGARALRSSGSLPSLHSGSMMDSVPTPGSRGGGQGMFLQGARSPAGSSCGLQAPGAFGNGSRPSSNGFGGGGGGGGYEGAAAKANAAAAQAAAAAAARTPKGESAWKEMAWPDKYGEPVPLPKDC
eukprot:TRINITY_DN113575_c0_g1_i1.p2 TRINITY_DN113575_c0_g1~~TRINITY_DN113575_c0_g1_i1.p2  ORF type:complete len:144 (+),score=34.50 TRINITY_DN113575_c0_g1_i1:98-529(+)